MRNRAADVGQFSFKSDKVKFHNLYITERVETVETTFYESSLLDKLLLSNSTFLSPTALLDNIIS